MSVDGDGKLRHVLPGELQAFVQGKAFGLIAYNAAAPTPAETGEYTFSTAGLCSWLTDYPTDKNVVAGDKVLVIYDVELLTYKYELVKRPDNVASQMVNDSSVEGASVKHALETLDTEKVDKVAGKSLIADTEITRLASVTNQTLEGLGGEPAANKKTVINNSDIEFPTSKAVLTGLAGKLPSFTLTAQTEASVEALTVAGRYYITMAGGQSLNGVGQFTLDVTVGDSGVVEMRQNVNNFTYAHTSGIPGWVLVTSDQTLKQDKADVASMAPQIAFNKRVLADGGTVRSKAFMQRVFEANKDLLADTELLFVPECGMKVTDGKIEKLYNLVGTNDAVQPTAANRPYVGGVIAPNEKAYIKQVVGDDGLGRLAITEVAFLAAGEWTILLSICPNKASAIYVSGGALAFNDNDITVYGEGGLPLRCTPSNYSYGKTNTIEFRYKNGAGVIVINGVKQTTTQASAGLILQHISKYSGSDEDYTLQYFHVLNRSIEESESQNLHAFLANEFPSIETIAVGSQQVATSNLEATVFGGTSVPEVQVATSVEMITNAADREFSSDTGFWTKGGSTSISDGVAHLSGNSAYVLARTNILTVGKRYQFSFTVGETPSGTLLFNSTQNNEYITTAGVKTYTDVAVVPDFRLYAFDEVSFDIDNISIKEVGWSELATPAWSHYDNSVANGVIYGKLYNGYAVDTIAANAPKGFHVPSELEWTQLSESLGGNTVSGGKLKALYGGFDSAFATNESGVSLIPGGYRGSNGTFGLLDSNANAWSSTKNAPTTRFHKYANSSDTVFGGLNSDDGSGLPVRIFSNTPHLDKLTYDSGWFATDIASSPKSIRIPFGCKVTNIKCITTTSVTAIEAKLFDYAGTELETLITGKACNATTKSFSVTADQSVSYTDNYVRVTAAGNSGTGMIIYVTIEPV